ncbi:MAG: capsular polysaccharide export protein, LipB/KpsS family [Planctomycetota bacterium]
MPLKKKGFYVADSSFFNQFKKKCPEIESDSFCLLKEWDIIRESKQARPDLPLLERYEKKIGQPFLWNALVADRRIYFGKRYAYDQDYASRFSHERMLSILQAGLRRMEALFDEVRPDFIVSFHCVTIGEYLSYLFARSRNIPILNLRPTRIRNYFYAGEGITEPSDHLRKTYEEMLKSGIAPPLREQAVEYLQEVRETHALYEGVVPPSNKPPALAGAGRKTSGSSRVRKVIALLDREYKYRFGEYRDDNHISGYIRPWIGRKMVRPCRARLMDSRFSGLYVKSEGLPLLDYAFFPLHTEPEVTLSVYSKPYLNQIEAVRLLSHNLPVGTKLLVKEHPWSIGKRPLGYYRKLLDIPNVSLADPNLTSRELISHSRLVAVIAGSIGFEGLMLNKPVVVLGGAPFSFLSSSMIRHISNPNLLGDEIRDLLENYQFVEKSLLSYIAAVMSNSVRVDFYSRLIGREGVYREDLQRQDIDEDQEREVQFERLARYLVSLAEKRA